MPTGAVPIRRYFNSEGPLGRQQRICDSALEGIRQNIRSGDVFPALRENEIHFYYGGGRILQVRPRSVYTHSKYLGCEGSGYERVTLTREMYDRIKTGCISRQGTLKSKRHSEGFYISRLFKRYSVWSTGARDPLPKLIDVECRFRGEGRKADQIDLLFIWEKDWLVFVEVKRQMDSRIRARAGRLPEVMEQISRYEMQIREGREAIQSAYAGVAGVLGNNLGLKPFDGPKFVAAEVPILMCHEDKAQGNDTWLWHRLQRCIDGHIDRDPFVVDGGGIDRKSLNGNGPPWCPNGNWDELDLTLVFAQIFGSLSAT